MPRAPDEGAAGPVVELEMDEGAAGAALAQKLEMGEDLASLLTPLDGDDMHLLLGEEGGEGMGSPQLRDSSDELGQRWLGPSADLPSDASDGDDDVQITYTSQANEGKPPSSAAQEQACCVCGGTREEDMLECIRCNLAAHSCCYYQRGSKAEGDAISAGDEWECEDCGDWLQWRPPADSGAPAPRPAEWAQTAVATGVPRGCLPAAAPRHPVVAGGRGGWGGIVAPETQVCAHTLACTRTCTHTYARTTARARARTHTHTQTHTPWSSK
jgi:hypothetical protein